MIFYTTNWPSRGLPTSPQYPCILLIRDNWNDFSFYTLFDATYYTGASTAVSLGYIKIMFRGQTKGQRVELPGEFPELTDEYCTLGQTLEYYRHMCRLGPTGAEILQRLRDVAISEVIRSDFEEEAAFATSLLRFPEAAKAMVEGAEILRTGQALPSDLSFKLTTTLSGATAPHVVSFNFVAEAELPHRLNILVGANGTGKTELLKVLGCALGRHGALPLTELDPRPLFSRIVAVSYNAFDRFPVAMGKDAVLTSYKYCGIRRRRVVFSVNIENAVFREQIYRGKLSQELVELLSSHGYAGVQLRPEEDRDGCWLVTRKGRKLAELQLQRDSVSLLTEALLEPDELLEEMGAAVDEVIRAEASELLVRVLQKLLSQHAETFVKDPESRRSLFDGMSAGQKIVTSIVCNLCAFIEKESLILLDEPETHLHPGLLGSFIAMLLELLEARHSFAVIATHSPVVLQQVPARYIHVLRRDGNQPLIDPLSMESFGANMQEILRGVLGLSEPDWDFHSVLRQLMKEHSPEAIDRLFNQQLPLQARLFLNSIAHQEERRE